MADATKVKTYDADGTQFDIHVTSDGEFYAMLDGEMIRQPTMKGLEEKLRKHVRTNDRIAIEATLVELDGWRHEKPEFVDIVLTGKHAGNDNVLYRAVGSKRTEQLRFHNSDVTLRLSKTERAEVTALCRQRKAAQDAVERWRKKHRVNAVDLIDKARVKVDG